MRIAGHPVHVMLVHFPVALWPAHFVFHLLAKWLPPGVGATAGFWLVVVASASGWLAAGCGLMDWIALVRSDDGRKLADANLHAVINGMVLLGFTAIVGSEWSRYPAITHTPWFLFAEGLLLAFLFVGNYFGGAVIWRTPPLKSAKAK